MRDDKGGHLRCADENDKFVSRETNSGKKLKEKVGHV